MSQILKKTNKDSEIRIMHRTSPLYKHVKENAVILQIMETSTRDNFVVEYVSNKDFQALVNKNSNGKR